jgi:3-phenylpropionate/cinnamic acid dioxygenase small subunit
MLLSSFTVLRIGENQQAANNPAKRALLEQKDQLEQKIDTLKYQKAAMDPDDYKKQLTDALVKLASVQQELDK